MDKQRKSELSNNGGLALLAAMVCGLSAGHVATQPVGWLVFAAMVFIYAAAETCCIWLSTRKDSQ